MQHNGTKLSYNVSKEPVSKNVETDVKPGSKTGHN